MKRFPIIYFYTWGIHFQDFPGLILWYSCEYVNCLFKACLQLLLHGFTQFWKWNLIAAANWSCIGKHFSRANSTWIQAASFLKKHASVYWQELSLCADSCSKQGLQRFSDCPCRDAGAWLTLSIYSNMGAPTSNFTWKGRIALTFCSMELVSSLHGHMSCGVCVIITLLPNCFTPHR